MLVSFLRPGAVVGSIQSRRRRVSGPHGAVGHGGRESTASRWGGAEAGLAPAGGAGELEERRGSPLSAASAAASPQAATGVGAQSAGSALQLLTCRRAGDVIHADLNLSVSSPGWIVLLPFWRGLTFPPVCPRWCTGNRGSAVWPAASRAPCRCPVATGCSARTAPPPQSAHCAATRPWSSSSPDLAAGQLATRDHHRFQTSQSWFRRRQPLVSTASPGYIPTARALIWFYSFKSTFTE